MASTLRGTPVRAWAVLISLLGLAACGKGDNAVAPAGNTDSAPAPTNAIARADMPKRIGWMQGPCLAIKNSTLKAGDTVSVVVLDEPQSVIAGTISGAAQSGSECAALLDDRAAENRGDDRAFYTLTLPAGTSATVLGIGIVNPSPALAIDDTRVIADLDGDGRQEFFESCNTAEGMNFYISPEASKLTGARWTDYYYLGYDLEPTCPE